MPLDRNATNIPVLNDKQGQQDQPLIHAGEAGTLVQITLNAVLAALEKGDPKVLCMRPGDTPGASLALPYGPFDPKHHRTFEIGLRDWVTRQTSVTIGYIEQLYTFGDRGREIFHAPPDYQQQQDQKNSRDGANHNVSVGYLAIAPALAAVDVADASWLNWYRIFPWEDWRNGEPKILSQIILPELFAWAKHQQNKQEIPQRTDRLARIRLAFGYSDVGWEEERILDRYELMYEAGLVAEAQSAEQITQNTKPNCETYGLTMVSDHRRILATAIGRLRGKLKYRPIMFEMIPSEFTLLELQKRVEAIIGFTMHKQNFRRSIEKSGLVIRSGNMSFQAGGRPAALFRVNRNMLKDRAARSFAIPRLKQSPEFKPTQ